MSRYKEMRGVAVAAEDDPNDEAKIPKRANDLRFANISLELRQKRLEQLSVVRKILKDYELYVIMEKKESIHKIQSDMTSIIKKLAIIRTKIDLAGNKLKVVCELKSCASAFSKVNSETNSLEKLKIEQRSKVSIYKNICDGCFEYPGGLLYDLMTLRNLILRVSFLEGQLSSSLSNVIPEDELLRIIDEADTLFKIIT